MSILPQDASMQSHDAAGLDMFVGTGLDYLSEVSFEDLDLFSSNLPTSRQLDQEAFAGYAPFAGPIGPEDLTGRLSPDTGLSSIAQLSQLPFMPATGPTAAAGWDSGQQLMLCHTTQSTKSASR